MTWLLVWPGRNPFAPFLPFLTHYMDQVWNYKCLTQGILLKLHKKSALGLLFIATLGVAWKSHVLSQPNNEKLCNFLEWKKEQMVFQSKCWNGRGRLLENQHLIALCALVKSQHRMDDAGTLCAKAGTIQPRVAVK